MAKKKDLLDRLNSFVDRRRDVIERDLGDQKVSRSFGSGFGFTEQDRELRGSEGRAEITANVMRPWVNKVISDYTSAPFTISARRFDNQDASVVNSILNYETEKADLADIAGEALATILNDGYAYVLVDTAYDNPGTKTQYAKPKLLDNGRTFFDECDSATGADCPMVVYLDLIRKETAEDKYDLSPRTLKNAKDPFAGISYYGKDPANYTTIATVYELTSQGCEISTVVHGQQIGKTKLIPGMSRIPIVRLAADKIWIESLGEWVYRGAYWFIFDLLRTINFTMSLQAERIATAPTAKFLAAEGTFNGMSASLADINKSPKLYVEYKRADATGRDLPPPVPFPNDKDYSDLMGIVKQTNDMVIAILGNPSAEPQANETAESVLLRRTVQEATVSRYLKSLKEGLEEIGKVMLDFMPTLFGVDRQVDTGTLQAVYDIESYYIVIDNGPLFKSQQQRSISVLMALSTLIAQNPANPVLPLIIKLSELDDASKQELMQAMAPKGPAELPPEVMQQMAAKDQQITQMQAQLAEAGKTVAALQTNLNVMLDDTQNKYRIAVLDNQTKIMIERMKLAANDAKLQAEIQADFAKQQQDIQADILKESMKLRAQAPTVPVFNDGRFI